jgi:RNA polymerase sigma-70 factor (ECF subfamily)
MDDGAWLADRFEEQRGHLKGVAYRMLGSLTEADDAVQEAWIRASRADASDVENLRGWLTTIVARICLNVLQSRKSRREEPLELHVPDPVVSLGDSSSPEHEAVLADSIGLALLVVLDSLTPPERVAFVLHDVFGVSFEEIAPIVDRSPAAARQLASRARRRVRGQPIEPDADLSGQRRVVDAFLAAAREGNFEALIAVLDPDVVLRADNGDAGGSHLLRGAATVAGGAIAFQRLRGKQTLTVPAIVNGAAGLVGFQDGRATQVLGFTVQKARIVAIDILGDETRLRELGIAVPGV